MLDVACGAGFLLRAYRDTGADVCGVDLSEAMLHEAGKTLGPAVSPDRLSLADAAHLPFESELFDLVTCKLALHYFPEPDRVVGEMVRVCRTSGIVALVDRVACDDPELCAAHNRLEKLRTPNKIHVYTGRELAGMLSRAAFIRPLMVLPVPTVTWTMTAAGLPLAR